MNVNKEGKGADTAQRRAKSKEVLYLSALKGRRVKGTFGYMSTCMATENEIDIS
jgi:hypothetical protein